MSGNEADMGTNTLTRSAAVDEIVRRESARLSPEEAESRLLDFWGLDEYGPGVAALPEELRSQFRELDSPPPLDLKFHLPLIELGLRSGYLGVLNEYLEKRLLAETGCPHAVTGDIEPMQPCPCCGYKCLRARGDYEICSVCFWEDDGFRELEEHSPPNGMSLEEAKRNFEAVGCFDARYLPHLESDRMERFPRG